MGKYGLEGGVVWFIIIILSIDQIANPSIIIYTTDNSNFVILYLHLYGLDRKKRSTKFSCGIFYLNLCDVNKPFVCVKFRCDAV